MTKTYEQLREQTQELNELRIVRSGAAIFYATKVRESGKKVESKIGDAKGAFSKAKKEEVVADKIDALAEGFTALGDALIAHRIMVGNLTGVALTSALLTERTDKQIKQLMRSKKRR